MRRLATVLGFAAVVVIGGASAALAQASDLDRRFDEANAAEFSGRLVTECETPDGPRTDFVDLSQRDGTLVIDSDLGRSVVAAGAFYDLSGDGSVQASAVNAGPWSLSERYHTSAPERAVVLGRPADRVRVLEGSLVRIDLVFDVESGAILRSVAYNEDGTVYCRSSFVTFSDEADPGARPAAPAQVALVPVNDSDAVLPASLAGFDRREVFEGPAGSIAGFYGDGLFSFTVLVADREVRIDGLADSHEVTVGGETYQRAFLVGQSVYTWTTPDGGYVMLGDQPLDLQEAVLDELPEPGSPGIITRFWRRLFG